MIQGPDTISERLGPLEMECPGNTALWCFGDSNLALKFYDIVGSRSLDQLYQFSILSSLGATHLPFGKNVFIIFSFTCF